MTRSAPRAARALAAVGAALWLGGLAPGCSRSAPRPSVVLAVLDTLRADAVSAYGDVAGTTPTIDALARTGLLYEHAYANANWTLPSHATLFTGLLPIQHGVRDGKDKLGGVPTLADLLSLHGYETFAFNENPWLAPAHGLTQGFERVVSTGDVATVVKRWLAERSTDRPFFLFLNIMDAHWPYRVRETNPFLPGGVSTEDARSVAKDLERYRCNITRDDPELAILRGLYHGNVRIADAKLGAVLAALSRLDTPVIVVATSDHGEHLGEHRLIEHDVGIDRAVTHVPLVVHGLPDVAPATIATPVQLADIMPAILAWTGAPIPPGLAGQPLPTAGEAQGNARAIVAEFHEYRDEQFYAQFNDVVREHLRARWMHCTEQDRVAGDMRAVIRFPYELLWYEKYPSQLFDLRSDPHEERDLAPAMPQRVAELEAHLQRVFASATPRPAPRAEPAAADVERLRALGYLGGSQAQPPGASDAHP